MAFYTYYSFLLLLVIIIVSLVCSDGVDAPGSDQADKQNQMPSLSVAEAQNWPGFSSLFSLNLLSSFPEDAEISEYCRELLRVFGQRYVAYVNCLIPAARPVKVCQSCFSSNVSLVDIYRNISEEVCDARAIVSVSNLLPSGSIKPCLCADVLWVTSPVTDWWWH